jgi:hypothetical protein
MCTPRSPTRRPLSCPTASSALPPCTHHLPFRHVARRDSEACALSACDLAGAASSAAGDAPQRLTGTARDADHSLQRRSRALSRLPCRQATNVGSNCGRANRVVHAGDNSAVVHFDVLHAQPAHRGGHVRPAGHVRRRRSHRLAHLGQAGGGCEPVHARNHRRHIPRRRACCRRSTRLRAVVRAWGPRRGCVVHSATWSRPRSQLANPVDPRGRQSQARGPARDLAGPQQPCGRGNVAQGVWLRIAPISPLLDESLSGNWARSNGRAESPSAVLRESHVVDDTVFKRTRI